MRKILDITNSELDNLYLKNYEWVCEFFTMKSGVEHYRLLCYISTLYENETLFDIGTQFGWSAIALSYNRKNKIVSYDINNRLPEPMINVGYNIGNALGDERLLGSPFIFLDTFHDGIFEKEVYEFLINNNYKGTLLLDDIHLNDQMKEFYNNIEKEKHDITHIGHHTGTGIVFFN
jgi:hypothetical protein